MESLCDDSVGICLLLLHGAHGCGIVSFFFSVILCAKSGMWPRLSVIALCDGVVVECLCCYRKLAAEGEKQLWPHRSAPETSSST